MPANPQSNRFTKDIIELNLAIIFISTSGVLGRYIDLPVPLIIASRALFAGILLYLFCRWKGASFSLPKRDRATVWFAGFLLGVHWITYFYSLKLSSVAIGMLSIFTFPAITAILEPLIMRTKILKFHLLMGFVILVGIYLLVPDFDLQSGQLLAVGLGVFSAFCYAIRNILMKSKVQQYDGSVLMVHQLGVIALFLSPLFFNQDSTQFLEYLPATLLLAIMTTAIGHTLFVYSFRRFSTMTASIASALQPVYGILMGIIFLQEYPEWTTIFGGLIILSSVVAESVRVYKLER